MAEKCANCGSPDTYAIAGTNGCYDCDAQTVTSPDVELNETVTAAGELPPPQQGEWVARHDVRPPPNQARAGDNWVTVEDRPDRPVPASTSSSAGGTSKASKSKA